MGRSYSKHRDCDKCIKILVFKEKCTIDRLGHLSEGKSVSTWTLNKQGVGKRTRSLWLRLRLVASFCEHGNGHLNVV